MIKRDSERDTPFADYAQQVQPTSLHHHHTSTLAQEHVSARIDKQNQQIRKMIPIKPTTHNVTTKKGNFEPVQYVPLPQRNNSSSPTPIGFKRNRRRITTDNNSEFTLEDEKMENFNDSSQLPLRRSTRKRKRISYVIPKESDIYKSSSEEDDEDEEEEDDDDSDSGIKPQKKRRKKNNETEEIIIPSDSDTGEDEDRVIRFLARPPVNAENNDDTSDDSDGM